VQVSLSSLVIPATDSRPARPFGPFSISNVLRTTFSPDSSQLMRTPELQIYSNIISRVSEVHCVFLIPIVDQEDKEI